MGNRSEVTRPSIYTVAKAAGTSVGTVSNVMNHPERVRPDLRERVLRVMEEQRFFPDGKARALTLGRTSLIATVFFDISNPFFAEATHALEDGFQRTGRSLLLTDTEQRVTQEHETVANLLRIGVDGLVICSTGESNELLTRVQENGTPVMVMAHRSTEPRLPFVTVDDAGGMELMARHLAERGLRRFCFVNERIQAIQHRDRWAGFSRGLAEAGLDPDEVHVEWSEGPTWAGGRSAVERALARPGPAPECFVCLNDYIAIGASKAVTDAGFTVGWDICVTGFDDIPYAAVMAQPLTTIRQPISDMAAFVVDQMHRAVEERTTAMESKTFEAVLVTRESA